MNGVIYARYSCEKQTENSILGQIRECKLFAERNDINIIDIYKDEAISGRTATKRPAFMKMINDASLHVFDCIIVWKGDRFSRSRADSAKYKSELKKLGIRVLSATEANVTGPEAILMDGINEAFAEYFSVELAAKVERGMTQNAIEGRFNGGRPPLGYKIENKKAVIDEKTSFIVKELFDLYTSGDYTMKQIELLFKKKGYTNNGRPFNKSSMYRILWNKSYYGHYEFKGTVNENFFPALITKEQFDKAQSIALATHKNAQRYRARATYFLTGKLICGECYSYMKGTCCYSKSGKQHHYYVCRGKMAKTCDQKLIDKETLENAVFDSIINFIWNQKDIEFYVNVLVEASKQSISDAEVRWENELNETNKRIKNLTAALEQGADFEILIPRLNDLKKIREQQELELKRAKLENSVFDEKTVRKFLDSLKLRDQFNDKDKKYLVNTFIDSIYLFKDKEARILFNFEDRHGVYEDRIGVRSQSHSVHQAKSRTMPFYCDGRSLLIGITFDLKPFIEARKARLKNKEDH